MLRVGLVGAAGRMGRLLAAAILAATDLRLVLATEHDDHPLMGRDIGLVAGVDACGRTLEPLQEGAAAVVDMFVDFSLPAGTRQLLSLAGDRPLVVGTTGLEPALQEALAAHARRTPVVHAPNFSTGVTLLLELARIAGAQLAAFDAEIVESHHRGKRDAPSGTALALAEALAAARGTSLAERARYGRHGDMGARPPGEIGIHALRGGDVVGEHRIILAGDGERIELAHIASSRQAFVGGAMRALRWVPGQPPGLYTMRDVLGL
ncbi:MAG: 4-hydroxy-tetrahydrodipicolinate reductase [Pseudomonadota bacterium]